MDFKDIGFKIKKAREMVNLSQGALSKKSGIAQSTLSYIENGTKSPTMDTMAAICNGLNVSIFDLLNIFDDEDDDVIKVKSTTLKKNVDFSNSLDKDFSNFKEYIIEKYGH